MRFSLSALLLALIFASGAWALEKEPFSEARFQELQAEGKLVLVDVFADWCSTCAAQQKVLAKYRAEHPAVELHILEVDFDKDREHVRKLRAPRQSTMLLFRGEHQFWYSVAETREDVVFDAINRAAAFEPK
jgi:thioredoxin 1